MCRWNSASETVQWPVSVQMYSLIKPVAVEIKLVHILVVYVYKHGTSNKIITILTSILIIILLLLIVAVILLIAEVVVVERATKLNHESMMS